MIHFYLLLPTYSSVLLLDKTTEPNRNASEVNPQPIEPNREAYGSQIDPTRSTGREDLNRRTVGSNHENKQRK